MSVLGELLLGAPEEAAPHLLGAFLISEISDQLVKIQISEVEAYKGSDDPASHAFRGENERNRSMFEDAGTLYVYRSYGIHHCANTSAGPKGTGWGILIRGGEVVDGEHTVRRRRGRTDQLTNGPGKICHALGINLEHNGINLLSRQSVVRLEEGASPAMVLATPRVGISRAKQRPWRFVAASTATPVA